MGPGEGAGQVGRGGAWARWAGHKRGGAWGGGWAAAGLRDRGWGLVEGWRGGAVPGGVAGAEQEGGPQALQEVRAGGARGSKGRRGCRSRKGRRARLSSGPRPLPTVAVSPPGTGLERRSGLSGGRGHGERAWLEPRHRTVLGDGQSSGPPAASRPSSRSERPEAWAGRPCTGSTQRAGAARRKG